MQGSISRRRRCFAWRRLVAAVAGSAALFAALVPIASAGAKADELLPDLQPRPPFDLVVDSADGEFLLGFASSTENRGRAELKMRGTRPNTNTPLMRANQLVQLENGRERVYRDAGVFAFVTDETHRHWHWLRFMRYELRRASDFKLGNPDVKTGFCVADRQRVDGHDTPALFPDPTWCEQENPSATELEVGLSVGWGDPYDPLREGQAIEVTNLPAGEYYLVHHSNPERLIRELTHSNNYSAALVELSWPNGTDRRPRVDELFTCDKTGTPGKNRLSGEGVLCGLSGNDMLRLVAEGRGTLLGGPGDDTLVSEHGDSTLDGGRGVDTVRFAAGRTGVAVSLRKGTARNVDGDDKLISIENAAGGSGDDTLRGSRKRNVLAGARGHDSLNGGAGDDLIRGGSGRDTLRGGSGKDRMIGGPGNDRIMSRDRARDIVTCNDGFDVVIADALDEVAADCEQVELA